MVKRIAIGFLALTMAAAAVSISSAKGLNANGYIILDDSTFADSYDFGYLLEVPSTENLYFEKDGVLHKATYGEIHFPDGATKVAGKFPLDIPGQYRVSYYSKEGASFSKEFVVRKTVYENGNGVTSYFEDVLPFSGKKGIAVNLVSGSSFKLNKVVNIHSFKNDLVDVINYYPLFRTNKDEIPAASFCTVKLVDAYNSDRFLEFYTWCDTSSAPYYAGAGSSEQNFTGLEYNPNRPDKINCVFEGVSYNKHVTTRYQVVDAYGAWGGMCDAATLKRENGVTYTWDLKENKTYFVGLGTNKLITDLDAPEVYDNNPLIIDDFFTTGEVYAQFECFGFNSGSMDIELVSVLGLSGNELKDAIVYDEKEPDIIADFLDDGKNEITISKGERFYIPTDVSVNDYNYFGDLKTSVYLNYGSEDQSLVYSSDYFVPEVLGKYSLVYTARDSFGNVSKKVIPLNCVDKAPFEFSKEKVSELRGAQVNDIPLLNVLGNNGDVVVEAYAVSPNGEKAALSLNKDKTAYSFVPLYLGEYQIIYEIKDSFYSSSFVYPVTSKDVGSTYFAKNPAVYPYYIKGASYSLDSFIGQKATSKGPIEVETVPTMSIDGGPFSSISNTRNIQINGSSSVKFKFSSNGSEYMTDEIKIVDLKFGTRSTARNYVDYFQGTYQNSSEEISSLRYNFVDSGDMTFVNPVSFSNFVLNFDFDKTAFKTIKVVVSDYRDENNFVCVTFEKVTSLTCKITIEQSYESVERKAAGYFNFSGATETINLILQSGRLYVNDYVSLEVDHAFELSKIGFSVDGDTTIDITKINNQNMLKAAKIIETGPQAYYDKKTGSFDVGSSYVIGECIASSVLSPVLFDDIKLKVSDAAGEIVTSKDGVVLNDVIANREYEIGLSICGQYRVNYIISVKGSNRTGGDTITNDKAYYIVNVDDTIDPIVTWNSHDTLEVQVHSIVNIRSYKVSDNNSSSENIKCYVVIQDYNGTIAESGFNVGKQYAFHRVGTFKVVVYAYDEYGNCGTDSYTVIVRA